LRSDFADADFNALANAMQSPQAAPVVVTLVEGLDQRHAALAPSLRRLAIAYEQLQRPADARATLERVALLDPQNTAHLLELARLADASKDYEGALGYLAHARDLTPADPKVHYLFAMVATELQLSVEARKSLERAIELDPYNPEYAYAMGYVLLSTRDAATAASDFERFVRARPQEARGHYALGLACFRAGDYAKAKTELQLAQNDPRTAGGANFYLGRIAIEEDDLSEAVRLLHKSSELMPKYAESHTQLARVLLRQNNFTNARAELDRALQLDHDSFEANEQLLVLYKRVHDPRADQQATIVKTLDEERSKRADLMLRMVEFRP
jgi:Flp pilus assembly protein TadD